MSFAEDFKELSSPSNYITTILAFVIMVATSQDKLKAFLWAFILFASLLIIYFLLRWIFVYPKEKSAWVFIQRFG